MNERLSLQELGDRIREVAPWQEHSGALRLECRLRGFPEAITFVNRVAELAEGANHHPDISIRWNRVILDLTTHSAGGLTTKDFSLAAKILDAARVCGAEFVVT